MRALLIDGSNLYFALLDQGLHPVNMRGLAEWLMPEGWEAARFYTAPFHGHGRFLKALEAQGFTLRVLGTRKAVRGESGVDVALAVDMVFMAAHGFRELVLVSGDEDLVPAVKAVRDLGARVKVAQFQGALSRLLVRAADEVVLLDGAPWKELRYEKEVQCA
ncbi:MAG: NYN domain-containing protein [Thermus sp.]